MNIEGQVAVISGGASGLGAATARHLSERGAKVAILDFNADAAQDLARDLSGFAARCDVTSEDDVAAAVAAATAHFGTGPRIAVNCAGIADAARIVGRDGQTSVELFRRVINVNVIGSYNVMSYAAQAMTQLEALDTGERGVIINTASIAFEEGQYGQAAYAASKGAIASMSLPAARELAKPGIRVLAIAPGLFHTPMMEGLPQETADQIIANIPFPHRLGVPEEYAKLVAHIVENVYLNATVIRLDGAVRLPAR